MDADLKKILKAVVLEMRHELEGYYDIAGKWHPGDLETRLAEIGVRKDRASVPVDELGRLIDEDVRARKIVDAFIDVREQAGVDRAEAVAEYVRESAYTWANRLVALRCMEARELLDDEVIVGREAYGGRSLVHHRLAQSSPELCTGEDDGRFAMLAQVFAERAKTLPMLFDPDSASIALRPSPAALKNCLAWLSGTQKARSQEPATDAVFAAPDALGWAYQYWNTEEKKRVFETVRTKKGAKIEGADIIPATQLYTEDYMVKFLVQNSLGATWMGMHPESKLSEGWEYYVRDADRAPATKKPLQQVTLLDPACGSGHFLIEAFDMFYAMYEEEGSLKDPEVICRSILENNLFGIDIDERAIQIAEASLWMKAEEKAFGFSGANTNLVAATSSHLKGESWERYLAKLKNEPSTVRVLRRFAVEMEHIDELGSLARPAEALESIINEEHEIWEKQKRERREADKSLFQEIRDDLLASQLPFQDISDKEFFERTMRHALFAIDGFTAEARQAGEFNDQLMGAEAKTGFRLLDLLSRKYDVVVANPPYMGSKNMGPLLKKYIESNLNPGKRDTFAAFMLRSLQFTSPQARVAVIVPQTWMFLGSFSELRIGNRKIVNDDRATVEADGVIGATRIETLCQLGRHAFSEADPPNNVAMSVFANCAPDAIHRMTGIRITMSCLADNQAKILRDSIGIANSELVSRPEQVRFLDIPESPLVYWLTESLHGVLAYPKYRFGDVATTRYGMNTGDNDRFVRMFWEIAETGKRWVPYAKAGGYSKWSGMEWYLLEWQSEGLRIRSTGTAKVQNSQFYFEEGVTYTLMARGAFGARKLPANVAFDSASLSIFPLDKERTCLNHILAISNCRATSYMLRVLAADIKFNPGYVDRAPFTYLRDEYITRLVDAAVALKTEEVSAVPTERTFDIGHERPSHLRVSLRHLIEGEIERVIVQEFGLTDEDIDVITSETGTPASWYPIINDHAKMLGPRLIAAGKGLGVDGSVSAEMLSKTPVVEIRGDQLQNLKNSLRSAFEQGGSMSDDEGLGNEESDDAEETDIAASYMPIPCETLVEELSTCFKIHPISVAAILDDGINSEGWMCMKEKQLFLGDEISVATLRLLGYSWPRQNYSDQCSKSWAADYGIIPLTAVAKEAVLQERIFNYLQEENRNTRDFIITMGKSVDEWLTTEFHKHHTRQFKKRPIAWQLQTSSFSNRKSPAFACLAYYHRMDIDAIPKIRSQYTGSLKLRFETEMRGISSTSTANRTESQAKRAVELEELIAELQAFDLKLATIAQSGFGPDKLLTTLRQYAFDDAMLSMKACWLQRLSVLLKQSHGEEAANGVRNPSPLDDWLDQANKTELHQDLPAWIAEALSQLSHFCSQVGPKATDAKRIHEDPSNADFGSLIQAEIASMQTGSMKLACGVWWGKFDAAVLAPIRERIKTLKAEQKELNAAIKEDRQPVMVAEQVLEGSAEDGVSEVTLATNDMPLFGNDPSFEQTTELTKAAMTARLKEVKAKIKKFTEEMDSKAGKAQAIRDAIQAWRLPDPIPASLDFSPSSPNLPPLFDQVSSLDERRSPPKTIADFVAQESLYAPDINDGVRVNIAPLQKAGVLAADVLAPKDVDKAIADRAEWRADERRWVREGKLPQPGWWKVGKDDGGGMTVEETDGSSAPTDGVACKQFVSDGKEDK